MGHTLPLGADNPFSGPEHHAGSGWRPANGRGNSGLQLLLAAALGAVMGLEREMKRGNAGLRTHLLVSMGACLTKLDDEHQTEA